MNKSEIDIKDDYTKDDFTPLQATNSGEIVEVQFLVLYCMLYMNFSRNEWGLTKHESGCVPHNWVEGA